MKYYNGSEWESEDLASPDKDGLMPKEDKATLDGASQYGKEFLTNADAAAARTKLGLSAGATAISGIASELKPDSTQTSSRIWSSKTLGEYIEARDIAKVTEAKSYTDVEVSNTKNYIDSIEIPKPNLNYREIKHSIAFRTYPGITNEWVQGFNINEEDGHYYLGLQGSTEYTIVIINKNNLSHVSTKKFSITDGAYVESLPYWKNENNELCFLVRTGAGATEETYNIFNYTTGVLSEQIPIKGIWRFGQTDDIIISSDSRTNNVGVFYVYDWESVKNKNPVLKTKIYPKNIKSATNKNQGMQALADSFITQQATLDQPHSLMEYDYMGNLVGTYSWKLPEVADEINAKFPGTISNRLSFKSEGEGLAKLKDNTLVSCWTVNEGAAARAIIVEHSTRNSKYLNNNKIEVSGTVEYTTNFGGSSTVKLVKEGRKVTLFMDGSVSVPARTTKALFSVPEEFTPVSNQRIFVNAISSDTSGIVQSALYVGTSKWLTIENKCDISITGVSRSVSSYDLFI